MRYFDSYKFVSTAYHSIEFHFKSLDTYLEGICRSHCAQHNWSSANMQWAPGKKSIFSIDDEYDEADMNAPDIDDEDMEEEKSDSKKKQPCLADRAVPCFIG